MKRALLSCLLILLGFAASAYPASAQKFAYSMAATCLNSSSGFNSKLEPNIAGTAWTESFHGVGSGVGYPSSTVTEYAISVIGAVPGSQPPISPAANAYTNTIKATITTVPNADGSFTLTASSWDGTITAGPNKGLTYVATTAVATTAGPPLKVWLGKNIGVNVQATEAPVVQQITEPVVQTITLSNKIKFERICASSSVTVTSVQ
jgi:hypothetical protein